MFTSFFYNMFKFLIQEIIYSEENIIHRKYFFFKKEYFVNM